MIEQLKRPSHLGIPLKEENKNYNLIERNKPKSLEADPYKEVAKSIESEFAKFMISKMRETVEKDQPDNSETGYYNSLLDSEYANILSDNNLGIQKLILDQINPRKLNQSNNIEIKRPTNKG